MKKGTAALTAILLTVPVFAWGYGPCGNDAWYGPHHWMGHGFFGGGIFMWILTLLLLAVAVFFGIKFYRNQGTGPEKPIDTLKRRLAAGEISLEEFTTLKKEL